MAIPAIAGNNLTYAVTAIYGLAMSTVYGSGVSLTATYMNVSGMNFDFKWLFDPTEYQNEENEIEKSVAKSLKTDFHYIKWTVDKRNKRKQPKNEIEKIKSAENFRFCEFHPFDKRIGCLKNM